MPQTSPRSHSAAVLFLITISHDGLILGKRYHQTPILPEPEDLVEDVDLSDAKAGVDLGHQLVEADEGSRPADPGRAVNQDL